MGTIVKNGVVYGGIKSNQFNDKEFKIENNIVSLKEKYSIVEEVNSNISRIDNAIDGINNSQIGENLLVYPYAWASGYDGYNTGVVPTYDDNGVLYLNGSRTTTNKGILFRFINSTNPARNIVELDADIYTLTVETSDFSNLKISYFLAKTYEDQSHPVNVDLLNNKTIIKIDNRNGEYKYLNFLMVSCSVTTVVNYDNVSVKVMLEKGNISHEYQPYQLSRQSLRDDLDRILAQLNLN